jgi:hypothetical protein
MILLREIRVAGQRRDEEIRDAGRPMRELPAARDENSVADRPRESSGRASKRNR